MNQSFEEYMTEEQNEIQEFEIKRLKLTLKLKPLTGYEFNQIQKECKVIPTKLRNGYKTYTLDTDLFYVKVICACVIEPDLYNAELQDQYHVHTPEELLQKMLLAGEYTKLIQKCLEICGFDEDEEEESEKVKN